MPGFSQRDSIISVHDSVHQYHGGAGRAATPAVSISLSPKQQVQDSSLERINTSCCLIWSPPRSSSRQKMQSSIAVWETDGVENKYNGHFIPELDSECTARVITALAKSGAFPGALSGLSGGQQLDFTTMRVAHDDEGQAALRVLKTLAQHDLVFCLF